MQRSKAYPEDYVVAGLSKKLGDTAEMDRGPVPRPSWPRRHGTWRHRLHRHRRDEGWQGARHETSADRRHRRLQHAVYRWHSDVHDADGERHLRHPGHPHDDHRGVHQQDPDRRVSWGGSARGDILRRAGPGHAGPRAGHGPCRSTAQELHQTGPVSVRHADGRRLRLGRTTRGRSTWRSRTRGGPS